MFLTQVVSFGLENGPKGVTVKMTEGGMCRSGCVCNIFLFCYRLSFLHEITSPSYPSTANEACYWLNVFSKVGDFVQLSGLHFIHAHIPGSTKMLL